MEELIPKQYKNSKELIRELLNNNKSFYLIKQEYLSKIIDNNKLTGKEIKYKFTNENSIIFEFSENDILKFSNNKIGIIEKSLIMNNENINEVNPYVELMINIYLFKEELKNKIKRNLKDSYE